jgi:hypothetical protein
MLRFGQIKTGLILFAGILGMVTLGSCRLGNHVSPASPQTNSNNSYTIVQMFLMQPQSVELISVTSTQTRSTHVPINQIPVDLIDLQHIMVSPIAYAELDATNAILWNTRLGQPTSGNMGSVWYPLDYTPAHAISIPQLSTNAKIVWNSSGCVVEEKMVGDE